MPSPSQRFKKSLTKDNLWIYILTLLKGKELYAYEIRKEVRKRFGFRPGNVTAYFIMKKLRRGRYIEKTRCDNGMGPERTYYTITPKGREEVKKAMDFYREMGKYFKS